MSGLGSCSSDNSSDGDFSTDAQFEGFVPRQYVRESGEPDAELISNPVFLSYLDRLLDAPESKRQLLKLQIACVENFASAEGFLNGDIGIADRALLPLLLLRRMELEHALPFVKRQRLIQVLER